MTSRNNKKIKQYYTGLYITEIYIPWFYVASLLHESPEGKPEAVEDGKVIGDCGSISVVLNVPFKRAEPAHEKEDHAHTDVGEDDAHPDLVAQRVHEGEDTRDFFLRLLDHNADAQAHKRLGEVDDTLPL